MADRATQPLGERHESFVRTEHDGRWEVIQSPSESPGTFEVEDPEWFMAWP